MTTANTTAQIATFLNVAPNAIKSVKMLTLSLEDAQKIIGDNEAIERGYVTEKSVNAAIKLATELKANGFESRDGMAIFPNVFHISDPIKVTLSRREQTVLSALAAYLMSV